MKNLRLNRHETFSSDEIKDLYVFCVDSEASVVYFISISGLVKLENGVFSILIPRDVLAEYIDFDKECNVICMTYLPFEQSISLITSSGNVLLCTLNLDNVESAVECSGFVESGVQACSWSPDLESLVILTGENNLMLMTQLFDPLWEVPVIASNFNDNKQVSVGWGAKETQFHGSEGKQSAKIKSEKPVALLTSDDSRALISWRGDGEMFVVSSVIESIGYRQLRIYDKDGQIISTSEDIMGLEKSIHWKPSGSLIASSQQHQNKHKIIFFEKNGLQHGEFDLSYKPGQVLVKELVWNADSSVLLVHLIHDSVNKVNNHVSWIELWIVNNYHWYLKQTIGFKNHIRYVCWDPEEMLMFHVLSVDNNFHSYKYFYGVDKSMWLHSENAGVVSVIDGKNLLITPFRHSVVPPPMSAQVVECSASINQVVYEPQSCNLAIITSDQGINFYGYDNVKSPNSKSDFRNVNNAEYILKGSVDNPIANLGIMGTWKWVGVNLMIFAYVFDGKSYLKIYEIKKENEYTLHFISSKCFSGIIETVNNIINANEIGIQLCNGNILRYIEGADEVYAFKDSHDADIKFQSQCHTVEIMNHNSHNLVFGLNSNFYLFCNNVLIAKDCTSFTVNEKFLLFTTHQHLLRCVALDDLRNTDVMKFIQTLTTREVERGSHLIISVPFDTKVILQMPRGNLETIHPRSLVLSVISQLLKNISYREAFIIMKKNRINLNLIYDFDSELFKNNVKEFIIQMNNPTNICLFVSELEKEDFRKSMYKNYSNFIHDHDKEAIEGNKVDTICDSLRLEMENLDYDKFILPILTCHIKKTTSEIENALSKIRELKKANKLSLVSNCLRHLLYIVDVNKLYNHALGMYDFDIVLMVAEKSQKDPKEYLPFLNELQNMEINYRHFKIDNHLKRYDKALGHLSKCDKSSEFMAYMENHKLYSHALRLFTVDSDEYKNISRLYADWLKSDKSYAEAGIWYCKSNDHVKAFDCFISGNSWRLALACLHKSNLDGNQLVNYYHQLINHLKMSHSYLDAASILENYLQDIEEAIVVLSEGSEFEAALSVVYKNNRLDLIETNLLPSVLDFVQTSISNFIVMKENFDKFKKRLVCVREEKERKALEFDADDYNDAEADLYSDISSVRSASSRSSGRSQRSRMSSKSRKKMEKKKYSLREGSKYEEEALMIELSQIVDQGFKYKDIVHKNSTVLSILHKDDEAMKVQVQLDELLHHFKNNMSIIWPIQNDKKENMFDSSASTNTIINSFKTSATSNVCDVDMIRKMLPPENNDTKWHLSFLKD